MGNQNLGKLVQHVQQAKSSNVMRAAKTPQPRKGEMVRNRQGDRINLSE